MNIRLSGTDRRNLALQIKADIDAACTEIYTDKPRNHLGASEIGEKCTRALVYSFRWMHREQFSPSMLRLFRRGHLEEARIIEWLRAIGCEALATDPDGKQFRMTIRGGFYGGSMDGKVLLPRRYVLPIEFLLEMKTYNIKSFEKLKKQGVKMAKPKHFAQMCAYGEAENYDYAIYFAVCKNDDNIYIEVVELDKSLGKQLADKAVDKVINAQTLPGKIAASTAFLDCKFCSKRGICHEGAPIDVNCRSCKNSMPMPESVWFCQQWGNVIPHEAISNACPKWEAFS